MKIVEPKVELLSELNISPESHIARCSRTCYGKEYKEPNQEADEKMVDGLIKRGHLSMLRHSSAYFVFTNHLPEEFKSEYVNTLSQEDYIYASTNGQFTLEHNNKADLNSHVFLNLCRKYPELFELYRLTFCIITQISTSRELNRCSPNAIAERSTRFCSSKDGLEIVRPWWSKSSEEDIINGNCTHKEFLYYINAISEAERVYKSLLDEGMKPEDARGILPLDTATKVIYTYNIREWQHILDLRYYGTTGKPHPNAKLIAGKIRDEINNFAKEHNIDYQV